MHLWDTMAQHPENAKQCIENIQKNARQKAEKENLFLKETYHLETLEQSDIAYYTRKYKQERYHINEEQLKAYFEFEHVLSYLHNFVKDAFGIELRLLDHSSSFGERWYEVRKNDRLIAYYFLDAFYRTGKKP
jgi:peptidyl-dipeptidase Dcp